MAERKQVSKREYLISDGTTTDDISKAVGARYTILANGKALERLFKDATVGTPTAMSAVFGWLNKVGNIVVSGVNDRGLTADEAHAAAVEWDADIDKGIWERPQEGGPAARIDQETLALVLSGMAGAKGDADHYLNRLKVEKGYLQRVIMVPEIKAKYHETKGTAPKAPKTADAVL